LSYLSLKECKRKTREKWDILYFGGGRKTSLFEKFPRLRPLVLMIGVVWKLRLKMVNGNGLK
jgi:hypothetical protein